MAVRRVLLPIVLRVVPVRRVVRRRHSPPLQAVDPGRVRLAERLARRLWRDSSGTCLARSVALYLELRALGASPALVLGLARPDDAMVGHAWVEVDGRPLLEGVTDPRALYVELVSFDRAGSVVPSRPSPASAPERS